MTKPIADTALIQSWVPPRVGACIKRQAKQRGLSVAAWIRMHFIERMADANSKNDS